MIARASVVVVLVATALVASAPALAAQQEVGHIVDFQGPPSGATVKRAAGGSDRLAMYAPLYAGDSVLVLASTTRVLVRLGEGAPRWVCRTLPAAGCSAGPALRVAAAGSPPSARAVAFRRVGAWLSAAVHGEGDAGVVHAVLPRGDGVALPLLAGRDVKLVAGTRALELPFSGGEPPFAVRIFRSDVSATVAEAEGMAERVFRSKPVALVPGRYGVEVRDAGNHVARASFGVVAAGDAPKPPSVDPGVSGASARLLSAAWLAGQGDGAWAWESYLRLGADAAAASGPAANVRATLLAGDLPPAP